MIIVNRVTGEQYKTHIVGSSLMLTSRSTGVKRLLHAKSPKTLFIKKEGELREPKVRLEEKVIFDLVHSLQLEMNYVERRGQKVSLKFL